MEKGTNGTICISSSDKCSRTTILKGAREPNYGGQPRITREKDRCEDDYRSTFTSPGPEKTKFCVIVCILVFKQSKYIN